MKATLVTLALTGSHAASAPHYPLGEPALMVLSGTLLLLLAAWLRRATVRS